MVLSGLLDAVKQRGGTTAAAFKRPSSPSALFLSRISTRASAADDRSSSDSDADTAAGADPDTDPDADPSTASRPAASASRPAPAPSNTARKRPSAKTTPSSAAPRGASSSSFSSTSSASSYPAVQLPPEYIADDAHLAPIPPAAPDLRALNHSLEALAVVFPDVQVDVFREMLVNFDGESRLALVADALLKNRVTWVKGRWRIQRSEDQGRGGVDANDTTRPRNDTATNNNLHVLPTDRFRSSAYKQAARALACREFVGLSRSTIHAVLAEQNYSYLDARRALVQLSSKSWRFTISALILRRKPVSAAEAENHPLIIWKSSGRGSILPTIKTTGSPELDRELYDTLIAPLRLQQRAKQEDEDRELAAVLNSAEAESAGAVYECACCFGTSPFEEVTTCSGSSDSSSPSSSSDTPHVVCFRCVQHTVREAVFGQCWTRTVDPDRGTMRCPAVGRCECTGVMPIDQVHRALLAEPRGADVVQHFERRFAELSLLGSGLPLVRCPFCAYAEVDDVYVPSHEAPLRLRVDSLYSVAFLSVLFGATPFLLLPLLAIIVWAVLLPSLPAYVVERLSPPSRSPPSKALSSLGALAARTYVGGEVAAAMSRFRRRRRGHRFECQNRAGGCGRVSCLSCGKAWTDIHVCHESALVALRTQVEQAMSMAIKRVCPRCHTSFVKTVGCNKLTCPCGYKMCYVCRRDISGNEGPDAGYRHFCDHFRPLGDGRPCNQCRKCNLWETEDTEAVLAAARREAERKWRETERRELSVAERAFLETGVAVQPTAAAAAARRFVGTVLGTDGAADGGNGAAGAAGALRLDGNPTNNSNNTKSHDDDDEDDYINQLTTAASNIRFPSLANVLDWVLESLLL